MPTAKFTVQRGKVQLKDVIVAAGSAEAQSDTVSFNVDYTNLRKGEVIALAQAIEQKIFAGKWPPL